jgi:hypothetical protein
MLRRPPKLLIFAFGGLTALIVGLILVVVGLRMLGHYVWGVEQLFRRTPEQPIAFPHPKHVDSGIDCVFCHRLAPTERMASVPPVEQCQFCHQIIGKESAEVQKVLTAFQSGEPINWVRVHRLPDHVRFVHEAHVTFFSKEANYASARTEYGLGAQGFASATCAICHGDVGKMEQVRQVSSLKMGNCVDCHRKWGGPTDCWTCHY